MLRRRGAFPERSVGVAAFARRTENGGVRAASSSSLTFDGVDDKSDLARALAAVERDDAAPPTSVVDWDAEELVVPVASSAPSSSASSAWSSNLLVLKPACSYGGQGIVFSRDAGRLLAEVTLGARLTCELPFHAERERIPGWVLQRIAQRPTTGLDLTNSVLCILRVVERSG